MRLFLSFIILLAAIPAARAHKASETPQELVHPLACKLGEDCWIARYANRGTKNDKREDYTCGRRTQEGHNGTDFVIADVGHMQKGVAVLAATRGTVLRLRDGMADISIAQTGPDAVKGKRCGNAVVLQHSFGLTTQYCHMKQGSLAVRVGDAVEAGQKIGEVGLSGFTEYPHMHLDVRRDGKRIDPFDGQPLNAACSSREDAGKNAGLWQEAPPYKDISLLPISFSTTAPNRVSRWQPQTAQISTKAPALILTGRVFNGLKGDRWLFKVYRPDGTLFADYGFRQEKDRQIQMFYTGKKRPAGGFQKGVWKGKLLVARDGKNGRVRKFRSETSIIIGD